MEIDNKLYYNIIPPIRWEKPMKLKATFVNRIVTKYQLYPGNHFHIPLQPKKNIYFSKNKTPWIMYIVIRLYTSIYCANQRDKYDKSMSCNVD